MAGGAADCAGGGRGGGDAQGFAFKSEPGGPEGVADGGCVEGEHGGGGQSAGGGVQSRAP